MERVPRLPQRYPFRFVDLVVESDGDQVAVVRWTAGSPWARDANFEAGRPVPVPTGLLLEMMAQSALALLAAGGEAVGQLNGQSADAPQGMLAGIDEARFDASLATKPLAAGDVLRVHCAVRGRFGRLAKVGISARRAEDPPAEWIARAELLLASG